MKYYISEVKYRVNEHFLSSTIDKIDLYRDLKKNGICTIPNFLSNDHCDELKAVVDTLIDIEGKVSWEDNEGSDQRIMGIDKLTLDFANLFNVAYLKEIYSKYIDVGVINSFVMANRVKPAKNNLGIGGGWHRDVINRRQLKFMVYLSDVGVENGCFQYIHKTHKPNVKFSINRFLKIPLSDYRYLDSHIKKIGEINYSVNDYIGKKGTLVIFDSSGIHRGKPIENGVRYAVTNYMWDTDIPKHIEKLLIK